jgi:hypothetical protein
MSTVQEIEAVLPKLSRAEIEEVRAWIDDFLEDQLELTDEVKARWNNPAAKSPPAITRLANGLV